MELRRRGDPRLVFLVLSLLLAAIYIIVGLQPAEAANYEVTTKLAIPEISLNVDVTALELNNGKLDTPDAIVGSYTRAKNKTLLIGHSTTVFQNLDQVKLGNTINYDGQLYRVVARDMIQKADVEMQQVLAGTDKDTIVIMTCAGQLLGGGDATHRLIITAVNE